MNAIGQAPRTAQAWSRVGAASCEVAVADRDALGTTARIVVWPAKNLLGLLAVVDRELDMLDRQASRFRTDSEVSRLYSAGAGSYVISDGLAEAVGIALAAARWTGGLSDPTVGTSLISLGYDRDFTRIAPSTLAPPDRDRPPGWQAVRLDENVLTVPDRLMLDLGATAKGLGADRSARAAYAAAGGGGIVVSLGGDMAVAGRPPIGGWPVLVADEHRQTRAARNIAAGGRPAGHQDGRASIAPTPAHADPLIAQQIRLCSGGLATSSVTCRRWLRGGSALHHIIDPRTGLPASGPWRTVSVAAASCAEANAAATAAIVAGDDALDWLTAQGLPARLIGHDGLVRRTRGWPEEDDGRVDPPQTRLTGCLNRRTR